jgi:protein subunit release factor A
MSDKIKLTEQQKAYLADLEQLNKKHDLKNVFKDSDEFKELMQSYAKSSGIEGDIPFDTFKAWIVQEQILSLQTLLNIEDKDLNEMLSFIVGSSV